MKYYSIYMCQRTFDLSGSQGALETLCVCRLAQLGIWEFNSFRHLFFSLSHIGILCVVTWHGWRFALHLLMLAMCSGEVSFELCPCFLHVGVFISPAACTHEVPSCKDLCITNIDCLRVPHQNAYCLIIVTTILNLLENRFNRLLSVPCVVRLFEVVL
jgi:hypothetical protein